MSRAKLQLTPWAPPPTRTHRQLADAINAADVRDRKGRPVGAQALASFADTSRKIGRLRWPGKGRRGTALYVWARARMASGVVQLYQHDTAQTYRRHEEARRWAAANLYTRAS